jgi:hypothetical protein
MHSARHGTRAQDTAARWHPWTDRHSHGLDLTRAGIRSNLRPAWDIRGMILEYAPGRSAERLRRSQGGS